MRTSQLVLLCLLSIVCQNKATHADSVNVFVIPYANPAFSPDGPAMWNAIVATAEAPNRNFLMRAVLNPDSGPGSTPAIQRTRFEQYFGLSSEGPATKFRDAGGQIVGYVSTLRGDRSLTDVTNDIDVYLAGVYAGNIDAIFFDDFYDAPADIAYYQSIYSHIQTNYPGIFIVGNAGNVGLINQLSPTQIADLISPLDTLVSHEMTLASYNNQYVPFLEAANYDESKFAHLVHDAGVWDPALLDLTKSRDAGWVYYTPDNGGNPWDNFDTTFWNAFVDSLILLNTPTIEFPMGRKLLDGVEFAGILSDLNQSDDVYYQLDPSPTKNPFKQRVDLILLTEIASSSPDCLSVIVEASMSGGPTGDVIQSVSLWDQLIGEWELVDTRAASEIDLAIQLEPVGNPVRFVHPLTNEVIARIEWSTPTFSGAPFTWSIDLDHAVWLTN